MRMSNPQLLESPRVELLRDAHVEGRATSTSKGETTLTITVNDEYEHTFGPQSRVSQAVRTTPMERLIERLNGGSYFFVNNSLVDFRDGAYNGFVHSDDTIKAFIDTIGITTGGARARGANLQSSQYTLGNLWSNADIAVPMYNEGGEFTSRLSYNWNPFNRTVNSVFELVRLICANGMVGTTNFLNARIPVENRWSEHLEIASRQIQNKINSMMTARLGEMSSQRATVADILQLEDHAYRRAKVVENAERREHINRILDAVSPRAHLGSVYKDSVFADRRRAAQLPSHLSLFDAYNVATEISTHTAETSDSSNFALDRFANEVVFTRRNKEQTFRTVDQPATPSFIDADAAFIGEEA